MRPLSRPSPVVPLLFAVALAGAACTPRGDGAPATDTTPATVAPAPGSAADSAADTTRRDSVARDSAPPATRRATTPAATTPRPARTAADSSRTDSGRAVRPTPPTRAPGGYIVVPPRARDSLRVAPPTSTRP